MAIANNVGHSDAGKPKLDLDLRSLKMVETYLFRLNGWERLDYEFNKPEHQKEIQRLIKLSKNHKGSNSEIIFHMIKKNSGGILRVKNK